LGAAGGAAIGQSMAGTSDAIALTVSELSSSGQVITSVINVTPSMAKRIEVVQPGQWFKVSFTPNGAEPSPLNEIAEKQLAAALQQSNLYEPSLNPAGQLGAPVNAQTRSYGAYDNGYQQNSYQQPSGYSGYGAQAPQHWRNVIGGQGQNVQGNGDQMKIYPDGSVQTPNGQMIKQNPDGSVTVSSTTSVTNVNAMGVGTTSYAPKGKNAGFTPR